jgi:hypothetical protein
MARMRPAIHAGLTPPAWVRSCTLITAYVPKDKLCIAPGAFLAFHSALTLETPPRANMPATLQMYLSYRAEDGLFPRLASSRSR